MTAYEKTLLTFGRDNQRAKLLEEVGELINAVGKYGWDDERTEMEIADVANVIESLNVASQGTIRDYMEIKMERTLDRIKSGYYV